MPQLMAIAEYVSKVHAICVHCGNLAHHSHRLADNDRLVVLGEKDIYEPLCRHCFNQAKINESKKLTRKERSSLQKLKNRLFLNELSNADKLSGVSTKSSGIPVQTPSSLLPALPLL